MHMLSSIVYLSAAAIPGSRLPVSQGQFTIHMLLSIVYPAAVSIHMLMSIISKELRTGKLFRFSWPVQEYRDTLIRKLNFAVMDHLISAEDEHQFFQRS